MNWEHVQEGWTGVKGAVRARWSKLTDDDVERIAGDEHQLIGVLRSRYGMDRDEACAEIDRWLSSMDGVEYEDSDSTIDGRTDEEMLTHSDLDDDEADTLH